MPATAAMSAATALPALAAALPAATAMPASAVAMPLASGMLVAATSVGENAQHYQTFAPSPATGVNTTSQPFCTSHTWVSQAETEWRIELKVLEDAGPTWRTRHGGKWKEAWRIRKSLIGAITRAGNILHVDSTVSAKLFDKLQMLPPFSSKLVDGKVKECSLYSMSEKMSKLMPSPPLFEEFVSTYLAPLMSDAPPIDLPAFSSTIAAAVAKPAKASKPTRPAAEAVPKHRAAYSFFLGSDEGKLMQNAAGIQPRLAGSEVARFWQGLEEEKKAVFYEMARAYNASS